MISGKYFVFALFINEDIMTVWVKFFLAAHCFWNTKLHQKSITNLGQYKVAVGINAIDLKKEDNAFSDFFDVGDLNWESLLVVKKNVRIDFSWKRFIYEIHMINSMDLLLEIYQLLYYKVLSRLAMLLRLFVSIGIKSIQLFQMDPLEW